MAYGFIKENLKNNEIINDDILLDYIHTRINEENVNDLIDYTSITNYGESCYNPLEHSLNINSEEIFLENIDNNIPDLLKLINKEDKNKNILRNPNCINIYNLHTINHEINHLIQKKEIIMQEDNLKYILFSLGKIQEFIDEKWFKSFYYTKYHDRFYNE